MDLAAQRKKFTRLIPLVFAVVVVYASFFFTSENKTLASSPRSKVVSRPDHNKTKTILPQLIQASY
jgi:hypothetical protein